MIKTKSLQSLLRHVWLMGAVLALLFPAVASAFIPSKDSRGNPEIIRQLEIVKDTLAVLDGKLDALKLELDSQGGDLDFLVEDAESQEKDIKISSTLCFAHAFYNKLDVGFGGEFGAEWPMLVSVNAKGKVDLKLAGTQLNLGSKICIKVPLHKLASAPLADFNNTEDFDDLIAGILAPSQAIIPLVATLYTAVMPSQEQAMEATANVVEAATGFDIFTGVVGSPNPANLLRPDILFEPIIDDPDREQLYQAFVDFIPTAGALLTDPCQALAASPLQIDINFVPICTIGAGVGHIAFNLVDPLHLLHPVVGGI